MFFAVLSGQSQKNTSMPDAFKKRPAQDFSEWPCWIQLQPKQIPDETKSLPASKTNEPPALHLRKPPAMTNHDEIQNRAAFDRVRYANCWEDADILMQALAVQKGDRCLSIASAGDNSLALLANDPDVVVACDVNAVQLACLEIRQAAFAEFSYTDLLAFLGFRACDDRLVFYQSLRSSLSPSARLYFDQHRG